MELMGGIDRGNSPEKFDDKKNFRSGPWGWSQKDGPAPGRLAMIRYAKRCGSILPIFIKTGRMFSQ